MERKNSVVGTSASTNGRSEPNTARFPCLIRLHSTITIPNVSKLALNDGEPLLELNQIDGACWEIVMLVATFFEG